MANAKSPGWASVPPPASGRRPRHSVDPFSLQCDKVSFVAVTSRSHRAHHRSFYLGKVGGSKCTRDSLGYGLRLKLQMA